jgi:hypothetical protein
MAITTLDGYIAAAKQKIPFTKVAARTTVATQWFSLIDVAGQPGAGTLAVGNTANGLVPNDSTAGYPVINAFGGANLGYLSIVEFGNSVACRMSIIDRLFHAGAYAFNQASPTTLASQPSYASRVPGAPDYSGLELWLEVVTAFVTGNNWSASISYTNQAGTAGRTATIPANNAAALTLGRMIQFSLQAGDSGVQSIQSVSVSNGVTAMTAGTFNILVARPLWSGRIMVSNDADTHGLDKTGMPQVYTDSALQVLVAADSVSGGVPDLLFEIVNG